MISNRKVIKYANMKLISFFRESFEELKSVQWLNKEEAKKLTQYVIIISILVGILVMGIDYILNLGLSYII
ncbi:preprotein translocase subunit SecE [bacterium]|nr:preprotein translocase subunit SecE [bacterium]